MRLFVCLAGNLRIQHDDDEDKKIQVGWLDEGGPRSVSSLSLRFSSLPLSRSCAIIPTISPSPSRLLADLRACARFGRMRDHRMYLITKRSFNYVVPLV